MLWRRLAAARARSLVGLGLLVLGVAAAVVAITVDANPAPKLADGDAPVDPGTAGNLGDIRANNSPTLARDPARPGNLAVVNRIDTPQFGCALHVSFDGGGRWSLVRIPIPRGEEPKCFAPDVAFAGDGTMYLSFVTLRGVGNTPHAAWLARSRDGGRTLSKPIRTLGPLAFQVRLSVDPANSRRLYLTWLQARSVGFLKFAQPGNPILASRSDDGGRSWGAPVRVTSPSRPRALAPVAAVGPRGELYVLYLDLRDDRLDYEGADQGRGGPPYPGSFALVLARSVDRGATWEESVVDDRVVPGERFVAFLPPLPSLAIDRRSGRVYAGFSDARLGDRDVWVRSLSPGASGWGPRTRVNDTPEHDATAQYLPQLAVAPNGRLDVVYYDRRDDPADVQNEVSLQSSFDQGQSFSRRALLSSRPFSSRIGFGSERGLPDLGNRLGLLSRPSSALAVWADTRAGTVASNKQDLSVARARIAGGGPLAAPVRQALLYGGIALALAGLVLVGSAVRRPRSPAAS